MPQNLTTTLIEKSLNYLGIKTHTTKTKKVNSKEPQKKVNSKELQKHRFPVQRRCLQKELPKLQ